MEGRSSFGWPATAAGRADPVKGVVVHYDGGNQGLAAKPHSACRTYWQNTRVFHMGPQRGWADIGYSFGLCPHAVVLEGRGAGRVQAAQPGGNATWYSVTFMSGDREVPTAAQVAAFGELRAWLRTTYGVGAAVAGHRDFVATSCPGDILYAMVKDGSLVASGGWTAAIVAALPTLKLGDAGEGVETLQGLLVARSHPEAWVTGVFDAVTDAAVRAVQVWGKVTADGVVGPKTWPVLLRVN